MKKIDIINEIKIKLIRKYNLLMSSLQINNQLVYYTLIYMLTHCI